MSSTGSVPGHRPPGGRGAAPTETHGGKNAIGAGWRPHLLSFLPAAVNEAVALVASSIGKVGLVAAPLQWGRHNA